MSRDVFPYPDDRELITAFLLGNSKPRRTDTLAIVKGHLMASEGTTIAWFDTAGALVVMIPEDRAFATVMRAVNEVCRQLGIPHRVSRETRETEQFGKIIRVMHYFIDDNPVAPNNPTVLMESLGMRAWRAVQRAPLIHALKHITTVGEGP